MHYKKVQQLSKYSDGVKDDVGGASGSDHTLQEELVRTLQLIDTTLLKCYVKVGSEYIPNLSVLASKILTPLPSPLLPPILLVTVLPNPKSTGVW